MIVQAVQTVRRNREECRQLVRRVTMIGDLLQQLQGSEMMQRPETRRPLDGLDDALQQAYMLVMSCQESTIMHRFFMARNQAEQFHDVQNKIDSYLLLYPLISYIDITRRLDRLCGSANLPGLQPQAIEEVLGSFSSHSNSDSRAEGNASYDIESVGVPAPTEPLQDGYGDAEVLPDRRHRYRWLFWWARTLTTRSIHRLIGHGRTGFTVFSFYQLAASTNNFSSDNKIGDGSYGDVYKGRLPNGLDVAIKINCGDTSGRPDFENEIQIISKLQHVNIIRLLGCCIEGNKKVLVYEYMPNGSLENLIERRASVLLKWPIWFRIIKGIAQGAVYLHQHSRLRIVHGDLKPSNIVLDHDMTPRITDFGIAEVLSSDVDEKETDSMSGTLGYVDPVYLYSNIISTLSDLYAFGVTVLRIITGQPLFIILNERRDLVVHAWELWSAGRAMKLIDPSFRDDEPGTSEMLRCIHIALLCVQPCRADRPTMSDALLMLSCRSMALPVPNSPHPRPAPATQPDSDDDSPSIIE